MTTPQYDALPTAPALERSGAILSPGDVIDGKYRVVGLIGEGGMGLVYEAENLRIARRVAIKVLHSASGSYPDLIERFEREAQAAARIPSHHIADVLDLGDLPSGDRYMVMELLEGESLSERMHEGGKLAPLEVASIAVQLLTGLAKMHEAGVVHRDLKPANIFLARTSTGDFVKILDLGVCNWQTFGSAGLVGTPAYMAPEQAMGAAHADARSDLYAVGVVLYRAVSGKLPYGEACLPDMLRKLRTEEPTPMELVAPEIDAGFAAIVSKAMSRDPARRYATAAEFLEALVQWESQALHVSRLLAEFLERPEPVPSSLRPPTAPPRATPPAPALSPSMPPADSFAVLAMPKKFDGDEPTLANAARPKRVDDATTVVPGSEDGPTKASNPRTPHLELVGIEDTDSVEEAGAETVAEALPPLASTQAAARSDRPQRVAAIALFALLLLGACASFDAFSDTSAALQDRSSGRP